MKHFLRLSVLILSLNTTTAFAKSVMFSCSSVDTQRKELQKVSPYMASFEEKAVFCPMVIGTDCKFIETVTLSNELKMKSSGVKAYFSTKGNCITEVGYKNQSNEIIKGFSRYNAEESGNQEGVNVEAIGDSVKEMCVTKASVQMGSLKAECHIMSFDELKRNRESQQEQIQDENNEAVRNLLNQIGINE